MIPARVVLDTNVFVAAGFKPDGHAAALLAAVRDGGLTLAWDESTRRETRRILERIPRLSWTAAADLFRPEAEWPPAPEREAWTTIPDPDDRKFAALAHAAQALLVSNDSDLLDVRDGLAVTVLTPREAVGSQAGLARSGPAGRGGRPDSVT